MTIDLQASVIDDDMKECHANVIYQNDQGTILFSEPDPKREVSRVPPAVYNVFMHPKVSPHPLLSPEGTDTTDNLIRISGSYVDLTMTEIEHFFSPQVKERYSRYGMVHKRGLLLEGAPGTGKTALLRLVMRQSVAQGHVVLLNPISDLVGPAVRVLRDSGSRPDQTVVVVWDEFEQEVQRREHSLLNLLDGIAQVPGVFYLAATNNIDEVPPRLRNRPSRFAKVVHVGPPEAALRRAYLERTVKDPYDIDKWVEATKGMVIDELKELVVSVFCLGLAFETALKRIRG